MQGVFLFFPQPSARLQSWGEDDHLRAAIQANVDRIFGDDREPHRSQRAVVPASRLPLEGIEGLTEWWLGCIARTWDRLTRYGDSEMFTIGLTLSRTFAESLIVNTSFNHLVRKTMMFHAIDKLASLRHRKSRGQSEAEVWKRLVSRSFMRQQILPFLRRVPACAPLLKDMVEGLARGMEYEGLSPRVLRAYRNTAHGYRIRDERLLLKHAEPLGNDLPDLLTLLLLHTVGSPRQATFFPA